MKKLNSKISFMFVFAIIFTMVNSAITVLGNDSNIVEINIVALNDFHGALVSSGPDDLNPGAARVVQAILDEKYQNPNTIVLAAGDMYMGTAISNLFYGIPVSHMLRLIEVDASVVGNHEFSWGIDQIAVWEEAEGGPFLGANIYDTRTNQPVDWAKPYIIKEVDGVNVAIIGLTTVETKYKANARNIAYLEFKDPVEIAERYVSIVKEEGADIIVLLTHISSFHDSETGEVIMEYGAEGLPYIEGVDAIITGHSHRGVAGEINGVPIVQGMHNGRAIAKIQFTFDKDANEIIHTNAYIDRIYQRRHEIEENQEMLDILQVYVDELDPILQEVIGSSTSGLHHTRQELSPLGQWTTEAMLNETGADIAFTNAGGLRRSLEVGDITMGMMFEIIPFNNTVVTIELTGAQIKEVFEYGIENEEFGQVQFSGVVVEHIPGQEEGNKVYNMTLKNGEPIDLSQTYVVAINTFIHEGGDGFSTFLGTPIIQDFGLLRDILTNSIKTAQVIDYTPHTLLIPVEAGSIAYENHSTLHEIPSEIYLYEYVYEDTGTNYVTSPAKVNHVVQAGDTLWGIARHNNTTVEALARYNNIANPNLIFVNQVITIA